jgi:hypothetical protein
MCWRGLLNYLITQCSRIIIAKLAMIVLDIGTVKFSLVLTWHRRKYYYCLNECHEYFCRILRLTWIKLQY